MDLEWPVVVKRIKQSSFYKSQFRAVFGAEDIDSIMVVRAVGQFERTLLSYRSKYDKVLHKEARFTQEEYEGFDIVNDMAKGDCLHCHSTDADALGVVPQFSNNGLDKAQNIEDYTDKGLGGVTSRAVDYGRFKVPSLRNVALTAPYMHDGRFKTLKEVLDFYSEGLNTPNNIDPKMGYAHRGGVRLGEGDKRKVLAFLHTLTDSAFIREEEFSNPFLPKGR
jgi:cytochrome c peroxidase